ncbi:MAG: hypothetical protein CFE24_06265 [Flavobacterium sp. BFFFF2]|nr:MAG: hypothetical protein CFE24_06265 [Flavobacterium sp. BFFFF2]
MKMKRSNFAPFYVLMIFIVYMQFNNNLIRLPICAILGFIVTRNLFFDLKKSNLKSNWVKIVLFIVLLITLLGIFSDLYFKDNSPYKDFMN